MSHFIQLSQSLTNSVPYPDLPTIKSTSLYTNQPPSPIQLSLATSTKNSNRTPDLELTKQSLTSQYFFFDSEWTETIDEP
jgi:hypothetical protein